MMMMMMMMMEEAEEGTRESVLGHQVIEGCEVLI
jgi:hypothetical protein